MWETDLALGQDSAASWKCPISFPSPPQHYIWLIHEMNYKSIQIFQCRYLQGINLINFSNFSPFNSEHLPWMRPPQLKWQHCYPCVNIQSVLFEWTTIKCALSYNHTLLFTTHPFWWIAMIFLMFWRLRNLRAFPRQFWWSITSPLVNCFQLSTFSTHCQLDTAPGGSALFVFWMLCEVLSCWPWCWNQVKMVLTHWNSFITHFSYTSLSKLISPGFFNNKKKTASYFCVPCFLYVCHYMYSFFSKMMLVAFPVNCPYSLIP